VNIQDQSQGTVKNDYRLKMVGRIEYRAGTRHRHDGWSNERPSRLLMPHYRDCPCIRRVESCPEHQLGLFLACILLSNSISAKRESIWQPSLHAGPTVSCRGALLFGGRFRETIPDEMAGGKPVVRNCVVWSEVSNSWANAGPNVPAEKACTRMEVTGCVLHPLNGQKEAKCLLVGVGMVGSTVAEFESIDWVQPRVMGKQPDICRTILTRRHGERGAVLFAT
jgi:hypothetical protein